MFNATVFRLLWLQQHTLLRIVLNSRTKKAKWLFIFLCQKPTQNLRFIIFRWKSENFLEFLFLFAFVAAASAVLTYCYSSLNHSKTYQRTFEVHLISCAFFSIPQLQQHNDKRQTVFPSNIIFLPKKVNPNEILLATNVMVHTYHIHPNLKY